MYTVQLENQSKDLEKAIKGARFSCMSIAKHRAPSAKLSAATKRSYADACGIARALDTVGERWALMVVRELLLGPKRFTDLRTSLPTIGPDVLTQRLKDLDAAGIVHRHKLPPPAASTVYELTPAGEALRPTLDALGLWGAVFAPPPTEDMCMSLDSHLLSMRTLFDPARAEGFDARVALHLDGQDFHAVITDGAIALERGAITDADAGITGTAAEVIDVMHGRRALADTTIEISGDRAIGERYLQLAPLPA
jgi:DNA-binding HxlR family transcriptional regulator